MDLDGFWALIERSGRKESHPEDRAEWLITQLAKLQPGEIEDFEVHFHRERARADTWQLWGAAALVCDGASDDAFWYFQAWLIGQGREVFERVVADPDALAELPAVRSDPDDFDWEDLDYVACEAYEEVTGGADLDDALEARGVRLLSSPDPQDEPFDLDDPAEQLRRYPRLTALVPSA
ncbi:DUF4240 domain-containing protein [Actinoplanes sp. Pm04-4]|uniref:DUF4240 domain-containing protein n=1 Tax=Paractinoplanes pyxinae TaxID=2997416 RepID=A0ABT4AW34_9ACTN|nr:DUF4240 domain-containing protein [Actinoplanes pyxinae]MCY1138444.1 DUF4240 domain-containing protein [Actinoplanes pyxinae]